MSRPRWGWRWDSDEFASRGLYLGPVILWSTHPVNGLNSRKPRIYKIGVGSWFLTLERSTR